MKSFASALCSSIAIVFLVAACARPPAPVERPAPAPFDLGLLKERSDLWRDCKARFRLKVESKKSKFNARAIVIVKGSYFARFETFGPIGQTAALFVSNEAGPSMLIPSEKVAFTARLPETLIHYFIGISMPFDIFRHILTASIPADQLGSVRTRMDGGVLHAVTPSGSGTFDWQFQIAEGAALRGLEVSDQTIQAKVSYDPPVPLAKAAIPSKIRLSSAEWNMEITVEELEPARDFQPSVFYLPNLPGIKMVDLDKIK